MMTLREDLLYLNYNYLNSHYPDIPLKDDTHFVINIARLISLLWLIWVLYFKILPIGLKWHITGVLICVS